MDQNLDADHSLWKIFDMIFHFMVAQNSIAEHYERSFHMIFHF